MTTYFFSLPDTEDLIDPSCSQRKKNNNYSSIRIQGEVGQLAGEFTFGILKRLLPSRGEHLMARKQGRGGQKQTHVYAMILSHFTVDVLIVVHAFQP